MQFKKALGVLAGTTLLFTVEINDTFAGRYHYQHQANACSCQKCTCHKNYRKAKCSCKQCHCKHGHGYGHYKKHWRGKHQH